MGLNSEDAKIGKEVQVEINFDPEYLAAKAVCDKLKAEYLDRYKLLGIQGSLNKKLDLFSTVLEFKHSKEFILHRFDEIWKSHRENGYLKIVSLRGKKTYNGGYQNWKFRQLLNEKLFEYEEFLCKCNRAIPPGQKCLACEFTPSSSNSDPYLLRADIVYMVNDKDESARMLASCKSRKSIVDLFVKTYNVFRKKTTQKTSS